MSWNTATTSPSCLTPTVRFSFPAPSRCVAFIMSTEASNEKGSPPRCLPLSWLKPKPSDKPDSTSSAPAEKSTSPDLRIAAPVEDDPKPVSFFTLFRSVIASFHPPIGNLDIVSPQVLYSHRDYPQCPCFVRCSSCGCRPGVCLNDFLAISVKFIDQRMFFAASHESSFR